MVPLVFNVCVPTSTSTRIHIYTLVNRTSDAFKTNNYNGKWMINDGDRHADTKPDQVPAVYYIL